MKHAITGPAGRINIVLETANDRSQEITDEQATLVASNADPLGYFLIEGAFKPGTQVMADKMAERRAAYELEQAERRGQLDAEAAVRLAALSAEAKARVEALQRSKAAHDAAAAVFESLTPGKQALWETVRAKVAAAIKASDYTLAYQTIATVPVLYPGMEDDRAMFLALFS